jgi:hypothetical protein
MARDDGAPAETVEAPGETPAGTAVVAVDLETIQGQLREKEHLVAALTERLEQAAEQLDRMRRTGVDKGRRPMGGAAFPAELVEDHKHTLDDLKKVIATWQEAQPGAALGRIEAQIGELRELMSGRGGGFTGAASSGSAASSPAPSASAPRERAAESTEHVPSAKKSGNAAWWEAQKAALMGEPVPAEIQAALAAPAASDPAPAPAPASQSAPEQPGEPARTVDLAVVEIPDLPPAVDFENITLDEAKAAIRERDRIIQILREPLLIARAAAQIPANLRSLENLAEPVQARITELEAQWQAKFRQVELDLSLERARLAREQAAVRHQQEMLQKQLRRGDADRSAGADDGRGDESSSSKRRWFRFMGKAAENGGASDPKEEGQ